MKKNTYTLLLALIFWAVHLSAQTTIYVSPTGSAAVNGSDINQPTTLANAITLATTAGVTIYLRGGTYTLSATQSIATSRNGASGNLKKLYAYPGDSRPILDFSTQATGTRGIQLQASYWHLKGFDIFKSKDNGLNISGSNNIIELCNFYENTDSGLQIGGGGANNQIINCDSYYNSDATGENADGFAAKLDVGTGNSFKGCRAWQNSDDGWDGYLRPANDVSTTYEDCWAFKNGYLKNGGTTSAGDGNGFKSGGSDNKDLSHNATFTRCLSFSNRVDGFDQNSNLGNITLLNCTAFGNGRNYGLNDRALATGKLLTLKNCVSAGTGGQSILAAAVLATNSWQSGFTVTNADFVSVDPTAAYGARQADGSLPVLTFMHLATGSDLINRGTNIGLAFNGSAPDLGCFETTEIVPISLVNFVGTFKNNQILLNWQTSSEQNNAGWAIERSDNENPIWQNIGFVKGNGTTGTPQYFSFLDDKITRNTTYYYRLKQQDIDGKTTLSKTISIVTNAEKKTNPTLYPNPAHHILTIDWSKISTPTFVEIIDFQGKTMLNQAVSSEKTAIDVQFLPTGLYNVVYRKNGEVTVLRFVKQ